MGGSSYTPSVDDDLDEEDLIEEDEEYIGEESEETEDQVLSSTDINIEDKKIQQEKIEVEEVKNIIEKIEVQNKSMFERLKGRIILKVEDYGKAYYVHPEKNEMYYLYRPAYAFQVMREEGVGITNENLNKIPIGLSELSGTDTDNDTLSDIFEDAIGIDKYSNDSDKDGYYDKLELEQGYNPNGLNKLQYDTSFANKHKGRIFLQVENNGEAWYVNPGDGKRYFLGRPVDAFNIMKNNSLGISSSDFDSM